jgi:hypothetical protein
LGEAVEDRQDQRCARPTVESSQGCPEVWVDVERPVSRVLMYWKKPPSLSPATLADGESRPYEGKPCTDWAAPALGPAFDRSDKHVLSKVSGLFDVANNEREPTHKPRIVSTKLLIDFGRIAA